MLPRQWQESLLGRCEVKNDDMFLKRGYLSHSYPRQPCDSVQVNGRTYVKRLRLRLVIDAQQRMNVLYHLPYPYGMGADRWICEAWRNGFERSGHHFSLLQAGEDLEHRVRETEAAFFFSAINLLHIVDPRVLASLRRIRVNGTKVLLWVHWPLIPTIDPRCADVLIAEDVADIYFGEHEQMAMFERDTGKRYHVIPHAADPKYHFPVGPTPKYQYDVVYLGANLPKKRWFVESILKQLSRRYRLGLFGPGWTRRDDLLRACSKACKAVRAFNWARALDQSRITVPPEEERQLYSSAKISLNFHERERDGSQPHYIVNQRTFKIPACGGFQICDDVPAIRKYFDDDEVVTAKLDPDDWLEKIEYYLSHDKERQAIQAKAARRALREHLSTQRVQQVLELTR